VTIAPSNEDCTSLASHRSCGGMEKKEEKEEKGGRKTVQNLMYDTVSHIRRIASSISLQASSEDPRPAAATLSP